MGLESLNVQLLTFNFLVSYGDKRPGDSNGYAIWVYAISYIGLATFNF